MPQMFDLYTDKTYDSLSNRTNSSMRYEHLVLTPVLLYMPDSIACSESTMDRSSKEAKMRRVDKAPLPFDHGVSLADATTPPLEWIRAETDHCLKTGALVRASRRRHVFRVFLVPKPGTNKGRLVMDFRGLHGG
eukprot:gene23053-biopygen23856